MRINFYQKSTVDPKNLLIAIEQSKIRSVCISAKGTWRLKPSMTCFELMSAEQAQTGLF